MDQYYILPIAGCTDPEPMIGPFNSRPEMVMEAKRVRGRQTEEDAIFWVVVETTTEVYPFVDEEIEQ